MQMMQPRAGLVFKTRTLPAKGSAEAPKKVFVNVVMHELVQRPLDAAMREVSEEHLDTLGIANLRVPLDVGEARACPDNSGGDALAIDVIFNPALVVRALQDSPGPSVMGQVARVGACALHLRAGWHVDSFARGRKHALTGPRPRAHSPASSRTNACSRATCTTSTSWQLWRSRTPRASSRWRSTPRNASCLRSALMFALFVLLWLWLPAQCSACVSVCTCADACAHDCAHTRVATVCLGRRATKGGKNLPNFPGSTVGFLPVQHNPWPEMAKHSTPSYVRAWGLGIRV